MGELQKRSDEVQMRITNFIDYGSAATPELFDAPIIILTPQDKELQRLTRKKERSKRHYRYGEKRGTVYYAWTEQKRTARQKRRLADPEYRQKDRQRHKLAYLSIRRRLLKIFTVGGRIACKFCGESDIRFLEVDHINGGGSADARRFRGSDTIYRYYIYMWRLALIRLQILCRDCNARKSRLCQAVSTVV